MSGISRRTLMGALTLIPAAWPLGRAAAASGPPPNILFVLADDWSWQSARAADELGIAMPNFASVTARGISFTNAYAASPTCTASRGAILTGRAPWQLEEGANLRSILRSKFQVYPDLLEQAGYTAGFVGKGWDPGQLQPAGRSRNPAGAGFASVEAFFAARPAGKPFCLWIGSNNPHRPYEPGSGAKAGIRFTGPVPPYLPDSPEVRRDIEDYIFATQKFDNELGAALAAVAAQSDGGNTLVIVTGDNGWPFPRSKASLYESGTHVPLAMMWAGRIKPGTRSDALVLLTDVAPTVLEAAGLKPPAEMTGRSLVPLWSGGSFRRDAVITAMERHMEARADPGAGYPMRALRTARFLYIRNFHPDRLPAGDPPPRPDRDRLMRDYWGGYTDIDPGPAKAWLVENQADPAVKAYAERALGKRPPQELYDVLEDPFQLRNLAGDPAHAARLREMDDRLMAELRRLKDPRTGPDPDVFERYPPYPGPGWERPAGFLK